MILKEQAQQSFLLHKKKGANAPFFYNVVPPGIEPGTHGFSVHCSTN